MEDAKSNKGVLPELLKEFDNDISRLQRVADEIDCEWGYGGVSSEYVENVQENWKRVRTNLWKLLKIDETKEKS